MSVRQPFPPPLHSAAHYTREAPPRGSMRGAAEPCGVGGRQKSAHYQDGTFRQIRTTRRGSVNGDLKPASSFCPTSADGLHGPNFLAMKLSSTSRGRRRVASASRNSQVQGYGPT